MNDLTPVITELKSKLDEFKNNLDNLGEIERKVKKINNDIDDIKNSNYAEKLKEVKLKLKDEFSISDFTENRVNEHTNELEIKNQELRSNIKEKDKSLRDNEIALKQLNKEIDAVMSKFEESQIEGKTFKELLNNKKIKKNIDELSVDSFSFTKLITIFEATANPPNLLPTDLENWSLENPDMFNSLIEALER